MTAHANRFNHPVWIRAIVAACWFLLWAGHLSAQPAYQFTVIADDPGWQVSTQALNNNGQVAFGVFVSAPIGDAQIIRANVGERTKIFGIQGQATHGSMHELNASINDAGAVAFTVQKAIPLVPVILTGDGTSLTTIADPTVDTEFASVVLPSIHNSANAVAFQASLSDGSGNAVIRSSGRTFTTIAGPGTVIAGLDVLTGAAGPTINSTGTVLFSGYSAVGAPVIAYGDGTATTAVATGVVSNFNGFSDNNWASFVAPGAVYKGNGSVPVLVASLNNGFSTFDVTAINSAGQVVFSATTPSRLSGVYMGPDPIANRLVAPGDAIPGLGIVRSAQIGVEAINNNGQIAFVTSYDPGDGSNRIAIVRADPICATNVSSAVTVTRGQLKLNRKTGRYAQTLTFRNSDGPISGPVSLVLDGLSNNAMLFQPDGHHILHESGGQPVRQHRCRSGLCFQFSRAHDGRPRIRQSIRPGDYLRNTGPGGNWQPLSMQRTGEMSTLRRLARRTG